MYFYNLQTKVCLFYTKHHFVPKKHITFKFMGLMIVIDSKHYFLTAIFRKVE